MWVSGRICSRKRREVQEGKVEPSFPTFLSHADPSFGRFRSSRTHSGARADEAENGESRAQDKGEAPTRTASRFLDTVCAADMILSYSGLINRRPGRFARCNDRLRRACWSQSAANTASDTVHLICVKSTFSLLDPTSPHTLNPTCKAARGALVRFVRPPLSRRSGIELQSRSSADLSCFL